MPPEYLSGRHRHPTTRPARKVPRHARVGDALLRARGRGDPRDPGRAWRSQPAGDHRPHRAARAGRTGEPRADKLDLSPLLQRADLDGGTCWNGERRPSHASALNERLAARGRSCGCTLDWTADGIELELPISNADRTVGATVAGAIARRWGEPACPKARSGCASRAAPARASARLPSRGMQLELTGEANDYVGKGLAAARSSCARPSTHAIAAVDSTLIGNTVLYGATGGSLFAAARPASASRSATAARRRSSKAWATMAANT